MNTRAHVHTQCTRTWGLGGQSFPIVLLCFPLCLDFPQKFHWETSNYYSLKEDSRKSKITFFLSVTEIYTTFKRLFNYISEISEVMLVSVH